MEQNEITGTVLAQRAGVDKNLVTSRIIAGIPNSTHGGKKYEQTHVGFTTADLLITKGMGAPLLWHTHFQDIFDQEIPPNAQDRLILDATETNRFECGKCKKWRGRDCYLSDPKTGARRRWCTDCAQTHDRNKRKRKAERDSLVQP
jgi:hypothetical protein